MKKMNEKKKAVRFFCICMAVLLFSSIMIWGFQTSWGDVRIERIELVADNGSKLSTLIYIPDNATSETPAPCAVIYHGRSNQAHSNDTWCMELARRGYVVLSPDLSGGGESDVVDREMQGLITAEYALSLDIVDKEQFNVIGYSKGSTTAILTAYSMPEIVNSTLVVFGPFMIRKNLPQVNELLRDYDMDVGIIKADADQYDYMLLGDPVECRAYVAESLGLDAPVEPNTDTQIGETSILRYDEVTGTMHQTGNISSSTIDAIISFENEFNAAPVTRENSDQAWVPQQIFSGVACVTMMFALAAAINLLMQLDFFKSLSFKRAPRKEQRGVKAWLLDILFAIAIPAVLFIQVSTWGMNWFADSKILTSTNLNGIMLWLLVAMCLIGLIRLAVRTYRRKAAGEVIAASDFCLAPVGGKFYWPNVGKALIIGLVCTAFFGLWMTAMEGFMGIDYQVWNLSTYLKPSPERVVKAIPYMIVIFIVMFSGNISQRVLPSTGNERKDMWIAVTVNTVLTASALFVLLLMQYGGSFLYGTGEVIFKQGAGKSVGALDFAFGYCYMMGGTTGVVTYLYRKHGNVLCGVIPASIFCGLFTLLSFTLVR